MVFLKQQDVFNKVLRPIGWIGKIFLPTVKAASQCESRVEKEYSESSSNTAKDMEKEPRKRTNQEGRLNIGQAVEPVEETFNGLAA